MKRTMKKVFALALAVMLVMALTVSAFATTVPEGTPVNGPYKITVNVAAGITNPGTFTAYQIFAGDLATVDGKTVLSNVTWGSAIPATSQGEALVAARTKLGLTEENCKTAADLAAAITDSNIEAFADAIAKYATVAPSPAATNVTPSEGKAAITVPEVGYYMVKSNEPENKENYAATRYILQVVGNVDITEKASVPSVEKKVGDVNDTTGEGPTYGDTADYDIGDHVPFTLTGTLPSTYNDYETYKYVFHDTLSKGLTLNMDSIKVTAGSRELTKEINYQVAQGDNGSFTITIENLKDFIPAYSEGAEVVVTYTAELNENAKIGSEGNPNEVYLEFSNNPNVGGEGDTGTTPPDKVVVFTFELDVNKVDQDKEALAGAKFALYKKVPVGSDEEAMGLNDKGVPSAEGTGPKEWVLVAADMDLKEGTTNQFYHKGLDDGEYLLVESVTPAGYNTIKPVTFTIEAKHGTGETDPLQLDELKFKKAETSEGEATFTSDKTLGIGSTTIENKKGTQLPSTGGMGTTILYIVGGVLAVGAAVILVVRKRMQSRQQSNQ